MPKLIYFACLSLLLNICGCNKQSRYQVTTSEPSNVKATKATLSGRMKKINSSSVSEKGFCYSTDNIPLYGDNNTAATSRSDGYFEATITGLRPHTLYYVKAYAKLKNGTILYGTQITLETNGDFEEGDVGPAGGIVFYSSLGYYYIAKYAEAILTDSPGLPWGCEGISIENALGNGQGYGMFQSEAISEQCGESETAAKYSLNFSINGFSDWCLPTSGDLQEIINTNASGLTNFPRDKYWSSSESEETLGFCADLSAQRIWVEKKSAKLKIIAVRYFD